MILLVDFYAHFWLRLSEREHLKFSSAKKATSTENFRGAEAPLPPCSGGFDRRGFATYNCSL